MKSGYLSGLGLLLIGTSLSLAGFQSHAWGVIEGALSGIGAMLMFTQAIDGASE